MNVGRGRALAASVCAAALGACASGNPPVSDLESVRAQVTAAERAFARTLAERNLAAFAEFVSEEAVFFDGPRVLRGRQQVVQAWARFFDGPVAPFSWEPDQVEPLASGTLAHSSGPVRDPGGRTVLRFNSTWRLEPPGVWRVVFDKGSPLPPPSNGTASSL